MGEGGWGGEKGRPGRKPGRHKTISANRVIGCGSDLITPETHKGLIQPLGVSDNTQYPLTSPTRSKYEQSIQDLSFRSLPFSLLSSSFPIRSAQDKSINVNGAIAASYPDVSL